MFVGRDISVLLFSLVVERLATRRLFLLVYYLRFYDLVGDIKALLFNLEEVEGYVFMTDYFIERLNDFLYLLLSLLLVLTVFLLLFESSCGCFS